MSGENNKGLYRTDALAEIEKRVKNWQETHSKERERLETFTTLSGLKVLPLYTPASAPNLDYLKERPTPGVPAWEADFITRS